MREQALDFRAVLSTLRRSQRNLVLAVGLGAVVGLVVALFTTPLWSSTTQVLLPPTGDGDQREREVETEVKVATSDMVLGSAGQVVTPALSAREVAELVRVRAVTSDVLEFEALGETPEQAEALAQAVADAELAYVKDGTSSLTNAQLEVLAEREKSLEAALSDVHEQITRTRGRNLDPGTIAGRADASALAQLTAQRGSLVLELDQVKNQASGTTSRPTATVIQAPVSATRPGLLLRFVTLALLGALLAALLAALVVVTMSRRDRRVRRRDDIADAAGSPVIASTRSLLESHTVGGWKSLLAGYAPSKVDAWAMRRGLHHLVTEVRSSSSAALAPDDGTRISHPSHVLVISLSGDIPALSFGPQLAAYMASLGVRTALVPAQRHPAADALWGACVDLDVGEEPRPCLTVKAAGDEPDAAALTVSVAVLDTARPQLTAASGTQAVVLAVSPGYATDEDLAHAAVAADDAGVRLAGVVVLDPDPLDRTTGRVIFPHRSQQVALPTRLTGLTPAHQRREVAAPGRGGTT